MIKHLSKGLQMKEQLFKYGIGIDVSKKNIHVCFMLMYRSGAYKIVASRKFIQSPTGFTDFLKWIKKHRKDLSLPFQIVMEVTGVYHEQLLYFLHGKGLPACLILSKLSKDYRKSIGAYSKNDKQDGKALAHLAIHRKLSLWEPISPHIYQIRSLMRFRKSLIENKVRLTNQLHALDNCYAPSTEVMASIKRLIKQIEVQIEKTQIKAKRLAKSDKKLWENINRIESSFTGLGLITLLEVISETNGFTQFHSTRQLVSYAGYDIIENQSGDFLGRSSISKRGNARIRTTMHMAAMVVIRCKVKPFYNLYLRVRKRNPNIKMKAHVAVQRKLLVYIYTLWKKKQAFDPQYCGKQQNRSFIKGDSSEQRPELDGIVNSLNSLPI